MRSSQVQRPQARFNKTKTKSKSKSKSKSSNKVQKSKSNNLSCKTAEDRVNEFLSKLGPTPIITKPAKKIHYATKSKLSNTMIGNKENIKPMIGNTANNENIQNRSLNTNIKRNNKNKQNIMNNNNNNNIHNMIQQRKTSMVRSNNNNNNNRNRTNRRKSQIISKSNSSRNSISPSSQTNDTKIDEYSLMLQIKNSECELLKTENKELKNKNMELNDIYNEHNLCQQKISKLNEELINKTDRIHKLEYKLESCGIDPIALKSPQFINQDTQKNIIFWRERLYKARQKVNDSNLKQKQMIQTARYYIQQLQDMQI